MPVTDGRAARRRSRGMTGGPGDLQVKAPRQGIHIQHFTGKIQAAAQL